MNLEKAIETTQNIPAHKVKLWSEIEIEALKLGIEAMKRLKRARTERWHKWEFLLPGETIDHTQTGKLPLGGITIKY